MIRDSRYCYLVRKTLYALSERRERFECRKLASDRILYYLTFIDKGSVIRYLHTQAFFFLNTWPA